MASAIAIQPDLEFKKRILGLGAHDLTACYQCGTCSVVCPISTPDNPFPRKEMVWAQWGLKDLAMANASIWQCHQCSACTSYCPREAKPSDVMAALRDYSIGHYAVPPFMGQALTHPKYLPLLFGIPAVIFAAILGWLGHLTALPEGTVVFSKFLPILYIEITFMAFITLSVLGALTGGARYWNAMSAQMKANGRKPKLRLLSTLWTILKHQKFRDCKEETAKRVTHKEHLHRAHLWVFYGFLGLVVTTTSVGIGIYAFGYLTPWPLWHPVKILGNVSGLAVIGAVTVFGYRRAADKEKAGKSTYSDWLFLSILILTTATGYLCELLRLSGVRQIAYPTYYVHMLFVFFLLVYFPYSKLAHVVYRTAAMLHPSSAPSSSTQS